MDIFKSNVSSSGFVSKSDILKYVTEESIFELVFKFKPVEYEYITSPFREDRTPGCYFEVKNGRLKFVDFGSRIFIRGVQMLNIDCYDAVQQYFKLPTYSSTLMFIQKHLIEGKDLEEIPRKEYVPVSKVETSIVFDARQFLISDKEFWLDKYEIQLDQLKEDRVFPVSKYTIHSSKKSFTDIPKTLTYAFTDFESKKVKLYFPFVTGKYRFITNCTQNDLGGIRSLPKTGKKLVITKSYKDWRVLTNQGLVCIWLQAEVMFPNLTILLPICNRFDSVVVFLDNDETGIKFGMDLTEIINSYIPGKASHIYLPPRLLEESISDPGDLIHRQGRAQLLSFLSYTGLI